MALAAAEAHQLRCRRGLSARGPSSEYSSTEIVAPARAWCPCGRTGLPKGLGVRAAGSLSHEVVGWSRGRSIEKAVPRQWMELGDDVAPRLLDMSFGEERP